ncbi:Mor transcription activator family protein [Pseudomonas putida]|uniref:Mor transcription activator family protein n=1 Tax=Pseudomonas putida TaxID=303 RepID=UPI00300F28D9
MTADTEIKPDGPLGEIFDAVLEKFKSRDAAQSPEGIAYAVVEAIKEDLGGRVIYISLGCRTDMEARNNQILADWRTGRMSVRDLAAKFDISQQVVYQILANANESLPGNRGPKRVNVERNKSILNSWANGFKSENQLAAEHNLSIWRIRDVIRSTQKQLWQENHK